MRASSRATGALAGLLAVLPAALALRGFTVDDALVSARVASHLARGLGYRFNAAGPAVDAVTPLGWAELLASFGPTDPLGMLARARLAGLVAWLGAAVLLGWLGPRTRRGRAVLVACLLGLSAPAAAWASSGMETGLVTALATLALAEGLPGVLAAGLAAAWRPELLGWASVLAAGSALLAASGPRERARGLLARTTLVFAPVVAIACLRHARFGSYAPLAVWAKPSDLAHGFFYAAGVVVGTGLLPLLIAPRALAATDGRTRVLTLAVATHLVVLVLVGGDWMALYRLAVPVLPTVFLAAARLAERMSAREAAARVAFGALAPVWILATVAWPGRSVLRHRLELIQTARRVLRGAHSIAALDVGWVGAATEASVVDLAGITDPVVAHLPGGHTSKRIPNALLEDRGVDVAVLLFAPERPSGAPWQDGPFARAVEARVAALPALEGFHLEAVLPLGGTEQKYAVVKR